MRLRGRSLRITLSWLAVAVLSASFHVSAGAAAGVLAPRDGPGEVALPADASTTGLAVAIDGAGHQHVFWRGSDGRIYEASYTRHWSAPVETPWFSGSTPSAAAGLHGVLYLAWQGAGGQSSRPPTTEDGKHRRT